MATRKRKTTPRATPTARSRRSPATRPATLAAGSRPAAGARPAGSPRPAAAAEPIAGVSKPEASPEQFAAFIDAQFHAHRGIGKAIALLNSRLQLTGDPAERNEIPPKVAEYQTLLQDMEADRNAFMAETLIVTPPSDDDVADLKRIVERLDKLNAASAVATEIIKLATQIAQAWDKTKA